MNEPLLPWIAGILFVIGSWALFVWVEFDKLARGTSKEHTRPEMRAEQLRMVTQIVGGAGVIVGLILTGFTAIATHKANLAAEVIDALEKLDSKSLYARVGVIYGLEQAASASPDAYTSVMETFTAFVRQRASWPGKKRNAPEIDIEAILRVIGRRPVTTAQDAYHPLNLSRTNLQGAFLRGANLRSIVMNGTNLERADLEGADLEHAVLGQANLAHASLFHANLHEARLVDANLRGADLRETTGIQQAQLEECCIDSTTRLPDGIEVRAAHERKCAMWGPTGRL